MPHENIKTPFKVAIEELKKYVDLQLEYNKVYVRKKMGELSGQLILFTVLMGIFVFISLFISLSFVNWYGEAVGSKTIGYLIVSAFYLFVALIVFAFRESFVYTPLRKFLVKHFSDQKEQEFFTGNPSFSDTNSTKKYLQFLNTKIRNQENQIRNNFKEIEEKLNWVNITKNVVSTLVQSFSTTTYLIKTAFDFGKKLTSGKKKRLSKKNQKK